MTGAEQPELNPVSLEPIPGQQTSKPVKDSKRGEKSLRKTIPAIKSRPSDKIALSHDD